MKRDLTRGCIADIRYRYLSRLSADDFDVLLAEMSREVFVKMVDGLITAVYQSDLGEMMRLSLIFSHCVEYGLTSHARREAPVYAGNCHRRQLHAGSDTERVEDGREEKILLFLMSSLPRSHHGMDNARIARQLTGFSQKRLTRQRLVARLDQRLTLRFYLFTSYTSSKTDKYMSK